jgi:mono/diheme cytochrome c family protein
MRQAFANQLAIVTGVLVILLAVIFALIQTPGQAGVTAVTDAPVIPHPLVGYENCVECHGRNGAIPYPANHLGWPNSSCTQCHLPADTLVLGGGADLPPAALAAIREQAGVDGGTELLAEEADNQTTPADQVTTGESVFAERCASCHVAGGTGPVLDLIALAKYGSALELFAYTRRTMPPGAPGSLSEADYWAVTAYMLAAEDLLPADTLVGPATAGDIVIE